MTITEFLLARIAEDEARARAAIADDGDSDEGFAGQYAALTQPPSGVGLAQGGFGEAAARMIATYAVPRRVLAECEAKRRIVDEHPLYRGPRLLAVDSSGADTACETCHANSRIDEGSVIEALGPCDTLLALASVYADHPDFDLAWRVS